MNRRSFLRGLPLLPLMAVIPATHTAAQPARPPILYVDREVFGDLSAEDMYRIQVAFGEAYRDGRAIVLSSGMRVER